MRSILLLIVSEKCSGSKSATLTVARSVRPLSRGEKRQQQAQKPHNTVIMNRKEVPLGERNIRTAFFGTFSGSVQKHQFENNIRTQFFGTFLGMLFGSAD